jgi:hypothetical protein
MLQVMMMLVTPHLLHLLCIRFPALSFLPSFLTFSTLLYTAAICGYASFAPVVLLAYDKSKPRLMLPARHSPDSMNDDKSKKKKVVARRVIIKLKIANDLGNKVRRLKPTFR